MGILGKKKEIGPDTVLQRNNEFIFNEVDGEIVMLSIENGEYYGMDQVGSEIWNLIEKPIHVKELASKLIDKYNVGFDVCLVDIIKFLKKLSDKNIITLC